MLVSGDVTSPEAIAWMSDFKQRVLAEHGFDGASPRLPRPGDRALPGPGPLRPLRPAARRRPPDCRRASPRVLDAVPPYFSQAILSRSDAGDVANVSFLIPVMPLDEQEALIDDIRSELDPPGRGQRRGRRTAGAGRRRQRGAVRLPLLADDRRPARRRARPARLLPLVRPSARAAASDRARDGLVGARPRGHRHPAQPDVGDPRRARDRGRDGVQRHPLRPLPRGAGVGPDDRRGAAAPPTRGPAWRCSPPGSPRSPASACSPSAGSRCCATSASSPSSISRWPSPA